MSAAGTVIRCDNCGAGMAAEDTYAPYADTARCRDAGACGRRALRRFDPTIPPDEDLPVPSAAGAPPGAACAVCGTSGPGLYERVPRSGQWACRDRDRCRQASVETLYLTA